MHATAHDDDNRWDANVHHRLNELVLHAGDLEGGCVSGRPDGTGPRQPGAAGHDYDRHVTARRQLSRSRDPARVRPAHLATWHMQHLAARPGQGADAHQGCDMVGVEAARPPVVVTLWEARPGERLLATVAVGDPLVRRVVVTTLQKPAVVSGRPEDGDPPGGR